MDDSPWMPPDVGAARPEPPTPAITLPPPVLPPPAPVSPWAREGVAADTVLPAPEATLVDPVATGSGQRPRRSKVVVGAAVAAVLAVGAAGVFAASRFTGAAEGGAADPTELGTALLTAIENEDVLGMTDVLLPGERDVLRQPLIDLVSELTRLEVLAPDADLSKIVGIDIELDGTSVTERATNVPDIVNVDLAAQATVSVDGRAFPVGDLVTDNMDPDDVAEMRGTVESTSEEFDVSLTAVEHDGRWYFSLFHTLAESLRNESMPGSGIPAQGIGADGGDSPEAAVELMFDRIEALDLTGMLRMLNPGEAAALQRYAPLFLEDAEAALVEVPVTLQITDREFRVEGDGDQRTVLIDALTVAGTANENGNEITFEMGFDGECVRAVFGEESFEQCVGGPAAVPDLDEFIDDMPAVAAFLDSLERALADFEPIGLELRSADGQWFVSPTATTTEAVLSLLRALDRGELDELIALGEPAAQEFFEGLFGGFAGADEFSDDMFSDDMLSDDMFSDDEFTFDDFAGDDPFGDESLVDELPVPLTVPATVPDEASFESTAWDRCYQELEAAAAIACFEEYVATGEIDASFIPAALRFPECGYAEVAWSGDLYSMSDADFIATVEAARPCFLALVDSGQLSEFELPTEIVDLECFEGRNWYTVFDDPAYDERYYACLDGSVAE